MGVFREFSRVCHAAAGVSPNHVGDCHSFHCEFILVSQGPNVGPVRTRSSLFMGRNVPTLQAGKWEVSGRSKLVRKLEVLGALGKKYFDFQRIKRGR